METNALELLKDAVYEEAEDVRLEKIAKACKKVSEILPFEKKRSVLLEQSDLLTYFLLCVPLFGNSIDLILKSMIDCFGSNETFLLNFWRGIEYVCKTLLEKPKPPESPIERKEARRASVNLMASVMEKLENPKNAFFHFEFCSAILQNKPKIKWYAMTFANILIEILHQTPKQTLIPNRINVLEFFLGFLRNTYQEGIIIKTCKIIMDWKQKWPSLWYHSNFDFSLEESKGIYQKNNITFIFIVLLQKQDPESRRIVDLIPSETSSPFVHHMALSGNMRKEITSSDKLRFEEDEKNDSTTLKKPLIAIHPVKVYSSLEELLGPEEFNELKNSDEKFAEDDEENKNVLVIQIENWICSDEDPPLIGKNEYISHFFKIHDNFKLLLSLILDPMCHNPSHCWIKKYPKIMNETPESKAFKDILNDNLAFKRRDSQPIKFSKFFNIYNLRSFKTLRMICDVRNYRHIYKANNTIVETYFACLYAVLLKDEGVMNMNHVAKLTEYFIKRNQDLSLNLIFNYNLLFKFMQYINFPHVRDFLLFFIGNFYHQTRLSIKNQNKLWRYLHNSHFFQDLARVMLHGSLSKLDQTKLSDMYKAIDIEINFGADGILNDENNETEMMNQVMTSDNFTLLEEFNGFRTDIDQVKDKLQVRSHVAEAKKLSNQLLVITAFKTTNKIAEWKKDRDNQEKDFGLGLAKKFIKKLEPLRLSEYIEVPIPKEDQVMKSGHDSPIKSPPNKSTSFAKSLMLTKPPVKITPRSSNKLPSIVMNQSHPNAPSHEKSLVLVNSSKMKSPLKTDSDGKNPLSFLKKVSTGRSPFSKRGYLLEGKAAKGERAEKSSAGSLGMPKNGSIGNEVVPFEGQNLIKQTAENLAIKSFQNFNFLETSPKISAVVKMNLSTKNLIGPSLKSIVPQKSSTNFPIVSDRKKRKKLYPLGYKDLEESKLETKAKSAKFSRESIGRTDQLFGLHAAEFLKLILSNSIENYDDPIMKKIIELPGKDYSLLFPALFLPENGVFFKAIIELLIESYSWEFPDNPEIRIQSLIVDDVLMSSRLLLVTTFYLILKNDKDSNHKLLEIVPDTCWHALLNWFFDKKHNNMYQKVFSKVMDLCMKHGSEAFLMKIIVKLNLVGSIYESLEQVYRNEVPFLKLPVESFFHFVVRIIKSVEHVLQEISKNSKDIKNFTKQLQGMSSWKSIMKICQKHFGGSFLQKQERSPSLKLGMARKYPDTANLALNPEHSKDGFQKLLGKKSPRRKTQDPKKASEKMRPPLGKLGSGDDQRFSKFGDMRMKQKEARTMLEINEHIYLPKTITKNKKRAINSGYRLETFD